MKIQFLLLPLIFLAGLANAQAALRVNPNHTAIICSGTDDYDTYYVLVTGNLNKNSSGFTMDYSSVESNESTYLKIEDRDSQQDLLKFALKDEFESELSIETESGNAQLTGWTEDSISLKCASSDKKISEPDDFIKKKGLPQQ